MYEATTFLKTQKTFIMVIPAARGISRLNHKATLTSSAYKLVLAGNLSRVGFLRQAPPKQPNCAVVQGIFNEILKIFHTMLSGKSRKRKKNRRKSAKPLRDNATATAHLHRLWAPKDASDRGEQTNRLITQTVQSIFIF